MESEHDLVSSSIDSSESPCSALLERLKNLRKWQDEQRKELIQNQSISGHRTTTLLKDENKGKARSDCIQQNPEVSGGVHPSEDGNDKEKVISDANVEVASPLGLSQELISSRNLQLTGQGNAVETLDCVDAAPSSLSNNCSDGGLSSIMLTQESNPNEDLSLRSVDVLPLAEHPVKDTSQDLVAKSNEPQPVAQYQVKGSMISVHGTLPGKSDCNLVLCKSNSDFKDGKMKCENDSVRRVDGLANFIKRHVEVRIASTDNVHFDAEPEDDRKFIVKPKQKFTFLRKGQGTSRFGMKPVRVKPKFGKNKVDKSNPQKFDEEHDEKSNSAVNRRILAKTPVITAGNYPSKASNRPIKTLQLQEEPVKVSITNTIAKKKNDNKFEMRSNETGLTKLSVTDEIHQKQNDKLDTIKYDKQGHKEQEELSAFEKLEELAEDSSFSSNSSTVVRLLQRGQHSSSSTPVRSPPPPAPHWTPILSSVSSTCYDQQCTQQSARIKLSDRMDQADNFAKLVSQENEFPIVNVSQVLEQLKRLIRLEDIDESSISQEGLKTLLESFIVPNASLPLESISHFANNINCASINPTSTPANPQQILPLRPRVHFRPEGVEVLEYERLESDEENTLTDTPSIVDDTDLVTTSDLEILAHFDVNGASNREKIKHNSSSSKLDLACDESSSASMETTPKLSRLPSKSENGDYLQPIKLQFSPPQHPHNSASHYIWSIFGKEKAAKKKITPPQSQRLDNKSVKSVRNSSFHAKEDDGDDVMEKADAKASALVVGGNGTTRNEDQDVETYKTLLLAKVCELEKEVESFKKENGKLRNLQELLQRERCQLESEKKQFELEVEREKTKLRKYIDTERNVLWKEKQALKVHSPSATSVKEQSLEIVYLKEQLHDMQEEAKKKESLHIFSVKKMNEKIKNQEEEIRMLKEKNATSEKLEKENMRLRHELDRIKLSRKLMPNSKPRINVTGKQKLQSKTATINNINKSLDRVDATNNMTSKGSVSKCVPELQGTDSSERLHNLSDLRNIQEKQRMRVNANQGNNSGSWRDLREIDQKDKNEEKGRLVESMQHPTVITDRETLCTSTIMNAKESPSSLGSVSVDYTELCRDNGTKEIIYSNGNKKVINPDGSIIMSYYNGDRKEIYEDRTVYIYGTDLTSHTTFSDGKELLEFPNGQIETRFTDGSSEIVFADNTRKTVLPDGTEICNMKDGTIVRTNPDGIKVFEFVSGQREVHTPEEKRREYPDGTVKILHVDGRTETRYKKGRIRIKDKEGNILMDTHQSVH